MAKTRLWLTLLFKEWAMAPQEPDTILVSTEYHIWSCRVSPLNGIDFNTMAKTRPGDTPIKGVGNGSTRAGYHIGIDRILHSVLSYESLPKRASTLFLPSSKASTDGIDENNTTAKTRLWLILLLKEWALAP